MARDLRTVQRQLDMLAQEFDIERDEQNKPFGYRWKERAPALMIPTLTAQESLLLTLAEQHLRNLLPASLTQSMDGFFEQARRQLRPLADAPRERAWLGKVRVIRETQPLLAPRIAPGVFEIVSNALYDDCWLTLDYSNAAGKRRQETRVMPLGLAQQGPRLYLVCRFDGFDNERSLALHRISQAERGLSFKRPSDFDLERYDEDGRFGFGEGKKIKLVFRIDKGVGAHLLESPLSSDQQAEELANAFEISATVVESAQLKWWLRGFGNAVEVKVPKRLLTEP